MGNENPKLSVQPMATKPQSGFAPDPVIEAYKKNIDRTLLLENLKLTVAERFQKFETFMQGVMELRRAGAKLRQNHQFHQNPKSDPQEEHQANEGST